MADSEDIVQTGRMLKITTPLGADKVLVRSFGGHEEMSRLFSFSIELVSTDGTIKAQSIVGQNVTLSVLQSDGSTERYFNGIVSRFTMLPGSGRLFRYSAEIVPWFWFLTRTKNCRIFQNMSVLDVAKKLFQEFGFTDFEDKTTGTHNPWIYCVQYRETAFDFISRMWEKEGIYYFFEHDDGKHTLIIADSKNAHEPCPYQSTVRMEPGTGPGTLLTEDVIKEWEHHYEFRPGKWTQTDYNFETPATSLLTTSPTIISLNQSPAPYEVFDYPGEYLTVGDGDPLTKTHMEEEEAVFSVASGQSSARSFTSGYKWTLTYHDQASENTDYVLISVDHYAHQGALFAEFEDQIASYWNTFTCLPYSVQFRPARITPHQIVHGSQTAVVVGPSGEEIYVDEYGRVKVQFFWDRLGKKDENSSCWIRVSQPWAGKAWGSIWTPRIGQEVVVDFLEGDPNQPLITGRVYNAMQVVPYTLPDNKTQSGFKSRSSLNGTPDDYNEIRFEDKKGQEDFVMWAQKDYHRTVENDDTTLVMHDRMKTINHDETTKVGHDRTEQVGNNEKITIGNDRTEQVGNNENITINASRTETVQQNEQITIGQNRTENVGQQEQITIGQQRQVNVGMEDQLTVGTELQVQAGVQISLQAGASSIMMNDAQISLTSPMIQISGSGMVQITGGIVMIN